MAVTLLNAVTAGGVGTAVAVGNANQNLAVIRGGIAAVATLSTTGVFSNNEQVVVGNVTYIIKTTPAAANDVQIGTAGSATLTLDHLKAAVNGTGTSADYFTGTVANPDAWASTKTASSLLFVATAPGVPGNSLASTETCANASFGGTTFASGGAAATGSTVTIETSGDNGVTWVTELSIAAPTVSPVATTHRVYFAAATHVRANVSTYSAGTISATVQSWRDGRAVN